MCLQFFWSEFWISKAKILQGHCTVFFLLTIYFLHTPTNQRSTYWKTTDNQIYFFEHWLWCRHVFLRYGTKNEISLYQYYYRLRLFGVNIFKQLSIWYIYISFSKVLERLDIWVTLDRTYTTIYFLNIFFGTFKIA